MRILILKSHANYYHHPRYVTEDVLLKKSWIKRESVYGTLLQFVDHCSLAREAPAQDQQEHEAHQPRQVVELQTLQGRPPQRQEAHLPRIWWG